MIKFGKKTINQLYLGDKKIKKAYYKDKLVYFPISSEIQNAYKFIKFYCLAGGISVPYPFTLNGIKLLLAKTTADNDKLNDLQNNRALFEYAVKPEVRSADKNNIPGTIYYTSKEIPVTFNMTNIATTNTAAAYGVNYAFLDLESNTANYGMLGIALDSSNNVNEITMDLTNLIKKGYAVIGVGFVNGVAKTPTTNLGGCKQVAIQVSRDGQNYTNIANFGLWLNLTEFQFQFNCCEISPLEETGDKNQPYRQKDAVEVIFKDMNYDQKLVAPFVENDNLFRFDVYPAANNSYKDCFGGIEFKINGEWYHSTSTITAYGLLKTDLNYKINNKTYKVPVIAKLVSYNNTYWGSLAGFTAPYIFPELLTTSQVVQKYGDKKFSYIGTTPKATGDALYIPNQQYIIDFKEVLEDYPEIEGIRWRNNSTNSQTSEYWNGGLKILSSKGELSDTFANTLNDIPDWNELFAVGTAISKTTPEIPTATGFYFINEKYDDN